ncbi:hypothetical protein Tco_0943331 [Tanacetum coccineum]
MNIQHHQLRRSHCRRRIPPTTTTSGNLTVDDDRLRRPLRRNLGFVVAFSGGSAIINGGADGAVAVGGGVEGS